jgi:hypothetical protein
MTTLHKRAAMIRRVHNSERSTLGWLRGSIATAARLALLPAAMGLVLALAGAAGAQTILQVTTPQFPLTPVGQSVTKNVTLTVPNGGNSVVYLFISLLVPSGDYSMGTITGCVVDGSTGNVDGTTCVVPITFTPTVPGSAGSPLPISRAATLEVFDFENGNTQNFGLGLVGGGTMPRAVVVPGILSDLVGNDVTPTSGFAGDGGPASGAVFNHPTNMAVDGSGNIYISDTANCVVRRIDKLSGTVSTIVGQAPSPVPLCGPGNDAAGPLGTMLNGNTGIAVDAEGNVYIADTGNGAVREFNPFLGYITTIAGQLNNPGYGGDGGPAVSSQLQAPTGIAVDGNGNIVIADAGNFAVREISPATGNIQTIAGVPGQQGTPATETYGGAATSFLLGNPQQVTVDSVGDVYIADASTTGVIEVNQATQSVSLLSGVSGVPTSLAVDAADAVHATLTGMCAVYKLPVGSAQMVTIAGSGSCVPSGDGGSALAAGLNYPNGVVVDGSGSFYILENEGVRFVDSTGTSATPVGFGSQQILTVSNALSVLLFNGDVPLATGGTPNPLAVYLSQAVSSPFAFVAPGTGISDCSLATATTPVTLNPGGFCSLSFTFSPQTADPFTGSTSLFEVSTTTGAQIAQTINLSGTGAGSPPLATLLDSSATLTAGVPGGVAAQQFTLTNTGGGAPLTVTSVSFADPSVAGFSQTNDCTTPLAQNQVCDIIVQYAPSAAGSVSQTLNVVDNAATPLQTVALTGVGIVPSVTLAGTATTFVADLNQTTSQPQTFTLTNTGNSVLVFYGIGVLAQTGSANGYFSAPNNCGGSLAAGGSCQIVVSFTGTAVGSVTGQLQVTDNASTGGGLQTIALNGTVVEALGEFVDSTGAVITATTFPVTTPGGTSALNVTFKNAGQQVLAINPTSWTIRGASQSSFHIATNGCGATLNPGATCAVAINFIPTALVYGTYNAVLDVQDDFGGQPLNNGSYTYMQQSVILLGPTGTAPTGTSSFSLQNATFPATALGASVTQSLTLVLNDASNVQIIKTAAGSEYAVGTYAPCAGPAGTTCAVPVTFTPSGIGTRPGQLIVGNLESGVDVPYYLPMTGSSTGTLASLTPGIISTVVGGAGSQSTTVVPPGTTGPATQAKVSGLIDMAIDSQGQMFLADGGNEVIWKVDTGGQISIYAGIPHSGSEPAQPGFNGDGGPAIDATLSNLGAIALDGTGGLYIGDYVALNPQYYGPPRLRYVDPVTQYIKTIAGANPVGCAEQTDALGDGCPASVATINPTLGMLVDPGGNVYFSDFANIRRIDAVSGIVTRVAGTGAQGYSPDGTPAAQAAVFPGQIALDSKGTLYFADNQRYVRKIDPSTGELVTITGNATNTNSVTCGSAPGEGGSAVGVAYSLVEGIVFDAADNLYIADPNACVVRRIDAVTQTIHTVAGTPGGAFPVANPGYGDLGQPNSDGSALEAELSAPLIVRLDSMANLYIASGYGDGVRKVDVSKSVLPFAGPFGYSTYTQIPFTVSAPLTATVLNAGNGGNLQFVSPFLSTTWGISSNNFIRDITDPTGVADCYDLGAVAPGNECPINVDFTPQGSSSSFVTAQDSVTDNSPTSPQVIQLSGIGLGALPVVTLSPALISVTTAQTTTTLPQTLMLTNNGSGMITISGISIVGIGGSGANGFAQTNNCGLQLAGNSSCSILVTFSPPLTGTGMTSVELKATLSVSESADTLPKTAQLVGVGTALSSSMLNILETVNVSDGTPMLVPTTVMPAINEVINISDAPAIVPATAMPPIYEVITVSDAPSIAPTLIPTNTSLQSSYLPAGLSLNVTVNPNAATGTVTLYDGGTAIASGPLTGGSFIYISNSFAAGSHTFQAKYSGSSTYAASVSNLLPVTVQPTLTITANSSTRAFGAANPALSYAVSGFVNGDTSAVLSGTPSLATTAALNSLAGVYPVTVMQGTLFAPSYYLLNFVPGTLTVNGGNPQQITFLPFSPQIPLATGTLTLSASSDSALRVSYIVTGPATFNGHSGLTLTGTGTVTVTATQAGNATFSAATPVVQSFEVTP